MNAASSLSGSTRSSSARPGVDDASGPPPAPATDLAAETDPGPAAEEPTTHGDPATSRPPAYARRYGVAVMLLITGLVGMIASSVLLAERVALWEDPNYITSCDISPWVNCGEVMRSEQSQVFGFPNIFIGIVAFSAVLTIAAGILAGARYRRWFWAALNVGVLAGLGFCVWLWYQAVFVISVLCPYCMVVWAAMIPMAVLLTVRNLHQGVIPASERVKRAAAEWAWPVIALIYVGVATSILLRFSNAFF